MLYITDMSTTHRIGKAHSLNRLAYAQRQAAVLIAHGATADQVRALPDEGRRTVEAISGEARRGSDETWAMVADLVGRHNERIADLARRAVLSESFIPPVVAA